MKLKYILTTCLFASCFFGSLYATSIKERNELATNLYEKGRYDDAITTALGTINKAPQNYQANWVCAVSYLKLEFYSEAIRYYKRVLEVSKDVSSYSNLGGAYAQLGGDEIAMAYMDTALVIKPDYVTAIMNKGAIHANNYRFEEAVEMTKKTLELDVNNVSASANLAVLYFVNGNIDEANNWLDRTLEIAPEPARFYQFKEEINKEIIDKYNYSKPRLLEALNYYEQNYRKNRYDTFNTIRLGECYDKLGNKNLAEKYYWEAINLLNDVIEDMPMAWTKIKKRGETYDYLGKKEEAIRDYRHVLEAQPNEKEVIKFLDKLTK